MVMQIKLVVVVVVVVKFIFCCVRYYVAAADHACSSCLPPCWILTETVFRCMCLLFFCTPLLLSTEGVQLLCLIDKGLDACRYLQTYGEWDRAAWLAKVTR